MLVTSKTSAWPAWSISRQEGWNIERNREWTRGWTWDATRGAWGTWGACTILMYLASSPSQKKPADSAQVLPSKVSSSWCICKYLLANARLCFRHCSSHARHCIKGHYNYGCHLKCAGLATLGRRPLLSWKIIIVLIEKVDQEARLCLGLSFKSTESRNEPHQRFPFFLQWLPLETLALYASSALHTPACNTYKRSYFSSN